MRSKCSPCALIRDNVHEIAIVQKRIRHNALKIDDMTLQTLF